VEPKDAKKGNLVFIDSRSADNPAAALLGDWERDLQLGVISHREIPKPPDVPSRNVVKKRKRKSDEPDPSHQVKLEIKMFEPYWRDAETGLAVHPMWIENLKRIRRNEQRAPMDWKDVVKLPWKPVTQLPLTVSRELLQDPKFVPRKRDLIENFHGVEGAHCHKQKQGYRTTQMAGTERYIFTFDKNERKKDTIVFNDRTQKEILSEIYRTEGHEPEEYTFGH